MADIIHAGIIEGMSETFTNSQRWLAIETSTDTLSLAVAQGDQCWAYEGAGAAKSSPHALPQIQKLMHEAQLSFDQLTAVVFGRGPGAFTGLRTACSLAQGLALGANVPVLPVDTLMIVAQQARGQILGEPVNRVLVVLDARMDQVYSAAYEWQNGIWQEVQAVAVHAPEQLQRPVQWQGSDVLCAGNAWSVYEGRWPAWVTQPVHALPSASALCQLATMLWPVQGGVDPQLALPLYVRDKVAQTTAEREQMKAAGLSA